MSWVADDRALDRLAGVLRETELAEGARVGDRYRIVRFIGRGGMGEVYLAADEMLHREVALKTLRRFRPGAKAVDLILAEARTVARLQHPGIVPIYDLGILPDGRLFYTMMYVAGRPLLEAMRRSADPAVLFLALCRAVAHAHEAGFVHGDLKPANVLVAADGGVMVLDWGLARPLASEDQAPGAGTPAYMAPELASATPQARDPRIDVFALGTILRQAVEDRPAADFDPVLRRALATSPDGRYRDAGELAGDVARVLQRRRARRQRGRLAVAAGVLALVGAAAAMFAMLKEDRRERARVHFDRGQALLRASERASVTTRDPAGYARLLLEAVADLERAAQADAAWGEPWCALGEVRWLLADYDAAERDLTHAIELAPFRARAWLYRGLAAFGRLEIRKLGFCLMDAEGGVINRSCSLRPPAPPAAVESMCRDFERAQKLEGSPLEVALARAFLSYARGDRAAARRELEELRRLDESDALVHALLGRCLEDDGEIERARETWGRALALRPWDAELYGACARVCLATGRVDEALAHCERGLSVQPRHAALRELRGIARARLGDVAGALEDLNRAVELDPSGPAIYYNRSLVHRQLGDAAAAVKDLRSAVALAPDFAEAWSNLGGMLSEAGEWESALKAMERAAELDPRDGVIRYNMACCRLGLGDVAGATREARSAVELSPKDPDARALLSCCLLRAGNARAAEEAMADAVRGASRPAEPYLKRAAAFFQCCGDAAAASADLDQAIRLDARSAAAYQARGTVAFSQEKVADALRDWERSIELDASRADALKPYLEEARRRTTE